MFVYFFQKQKDEHVRKENILKVFPGVIESSRFSVKWQSNSIHCRKGHVRTQESIRYFTFEMIKLQI